MPPVRTRRTVLLFLAVAAAIGIGAFVLRPSPISVATAKATRGPMRVTIDEDGETRAHDRFVVAAPIPGRLLRVDLEDGDPVRQGQVVARIEPLPLNQQQREEVLARIQAAEATERQAQARATHAQEDYAQSKRDLVRAEELGRQGIVSPQAVEQARNAESTNAQELEAAKFSALSAAAEVKVAQAGLVGMASGAARPQTILLYSPVAGRALRVIEKSERVLQAGAPIIVLGDPAKIEIVTDILTTDAVNVEPGAAVLIESWGGDHPLRAKVRLVEPAGFTKISALGVEEKRVNVISDFVDSPDGLADGFRVETRIVTWEGQNVLKVPSSAAFRSGEGWSVFVVDRGRARLRDITIGARNPLELEILRGITDGQEVILHPSNQLREGDRLQAQ